MVLKGLKRKVRKAIIGISAISLLVGSLSGCSSAELKLMNMSREIDSWNNYTTEGVVNIEMSDSATSLFVPSEKMNSINMTYNVKSDKKNDVWGINGKIEIADTVYPVDIRINKGTVAVSKETVKTVWSLKSSYDNPNVSEEDIDLVLSSLKDNEYVIVEDKSNEQENKSDTNEVSAVTKMIPKILENYTTGAVSENNRGEIEIEIDLEDLDNILGEFIKHLEDNKDSLSGLIGSSKDNSIVKKDETVDGVINSITGVKTIIGDKTIQDIFKGSYYKNISSLKDNVYSTENRLVITDKNYSQGSMNLDLSVTMLADTKKVDSLEFDAIEFRDIDEIAGLSDIIGLTSEEKSNNCSQYATIDYTSNSNRAQLTVVKCEELENIPTISEIDIQIIDDSAYLPMRKIAEALGYEVEWDTESKKAYAIVNGENVDMTGVIINDTTYVKVRDFEKLNFEVSYYEDVETGEKSIALISQ